MKQPINYEDCVYVKCFLSEDYPSSKRICPKVDQSVIQQQLTTSKEICAVYFK